MVRHGEEVLERHGRKPGVSQPAGARKPGKAEVDLHLSAQHGERDAHLLFLHVLERLRRLIARAAGVPVSWVHFASHFLSRLDALELAADAGTVEGDVARDRTEGSKAPELGELNHTHTVHCDESSYARFHHSGVLWLTEQDDQTGGELQFWDSDHHVWRRRVRPLVGRAALFTSGWENIHQVTPIRRGRRWSLPLFASLLPPFNATRLAKACVRPAGSRQWEYCEDRLHQWLSTPDQDLL